MKSKKIKKNKKTNIIKKTNRGGSYLSRRDKKKCSPHNNDNNFSCFSKKSLLKICEAWNNYYEDKIIYNKKNNINTLWYKVNDKLKNSCNNEWCWIQQEFLKKINNDNLKDSFRPLMPKKWYSHEREWLNTYDIENVMQQYEKKHKDFKFIGPVPIDFDYQPNPGQCIVNELCNISVPKLIKKGIKKLGVIFNLDPHDKPGSHWVALYCDINRGGVYYFDSYGVEPPEEVDILMDRLASQGKSFNNNIKKQYNNIRHQYKNSECGVYSLNFIIKLLEGNNFKDVINNIVPDDVMLKNRNVFFVRND